MPTLPATRHQNAKDGPADVAGREYLEQPAADACVVDSASLLEDLGLLNSPSNVEDEQSGQYSDPEHRSPGNIGGHQGKERREDNRGQTPAEVPRRLNNADGP